MNVRKTVKKIVALGMGATMLGATVFGAAAANLNNLPAPFIKDGKFDAVIVVGANAATADVIGAIDIATRMQSEAVTTKTVDVAGAGATVSVEGGQLVQETGNKLSFNGELLKSVKSSFDDGDFDFLADGIVEDDSSGTEYDYSQKIYLGSQLVTFGRPDNNLYDMPVAYLTNMSVPLLNFSVDFEDNVNWTILDDSETIEIFGKPFTISDIAAGDKVVLFGSDTTINVANGETKTVEIDGTSYEISILGGNADSATAIVSVNGVSKSLAEGDNRKLGGLDILVKDVFISNIGGESVSVNLFVGSEEYELPAVGTGLGTVKLNGETLKGVKAAISGSTGDVTGMHFEVTAGDIDNDANGEDWDWIEMGGDGFVDPMFGIEVNFAGVSEGFMADTRQHIEMARDGDEIKFAFNNQDGDEIEFNVYADSNLANVTWAENFAGIAAAAGNNLVEDNLFLLEEGTGNVLVSKLYEVVDIDAVSSPNVVEIRDVARGTTKDYKVGDELGSTGVTVDAIASGAFSLSADTLIHVYTKNDMKITFSDVATPTATATVTFDEDNHAQLSDEVAGTTWTATIDNDGTDDELDITAVSPSSVADDDNNYAYAGTAYGTFVVLEEDDNGASLDVYYPTQDIYFNVFVAPTGAQVTTTSAGGVQTQTVERINVGASVLDTNAPAVGAANMIVVGGPCVNTVAAELMGAGADCAAGFESGKAMVKLYENNGKVAMLVAGYSAADTTRATTVVAKYDQYDLSGDEVVVSGTSPTNIQVSKAN